METAKISILPPGIVISTDGRTAKGFRASSSSGWKDVRNLGSSIYRRCFQASDKKSTTLDSIFHIAFRSFLLSFLLLLQLGMAIRQVFKRSLSSKKRSNSTGLADMPKGHCTVNVGESECKQRFVIPVSYLNHASFSGFAMSSSGRIMILP